MRAQTTLSHLILFLFLAALIGGCLATAPEDDDDAVEPTPEPTPEPPRTPDWTDHSGGLDDFEFDHLPTIYAYPEHPAPGGEVVVVAEHADATEIAVQPTGDGCGTLTATTGPSPQELTVAAGATGDCRIGATVTLADGSTEYTEGWFAVRPLLGGAPPLEVAEAGWQPAPLVEADPSSTGPEGLGLLGATSFVTGQTVTWEVDWTGVEPPTALLLAVDGFEGHFRMPVDPEQALPTLSVRFAQDFFAQLPAARDIGITVRMALIAGTSRPRNVMSWALSGQEVGFGEVQVGITWNTATDVDLHVIEPSGEEIYYAHTTSATGGSLDLDSNPGCNIDGVNTENIFWPDGQAPPGDFTVRVNMYDDCEVGSASGTLTIHHCGDDSPEEHPFALGESGAQEFTFTNPGCGYSVAGQVTYEDFTPGASSLRFDGFKPARFITVQAIRPDGSVLGEARTDRAGRYLVRFLDTEDSTPTYKVRAIATQDDAVVRQRVLNYDTSAFWDLDEEMWAWETEQTFEAEADPHNTVDMAVTQNQGAGALNIFDAGVRGLEYLRAHTRTAPRPLIWYWNKGEGHKTAFSKDPWGIYVAGRTVDPDEYDETTLLHEYGHMVMETYSVDDSGGGDHDVFNWERPTKAWSEGWAHYFGCVAADSRQMVNGRADGYRWRVTLDTLPVRAADGSGDGMRLGTQGDAFAGEISEAAVASILWDLHDTTNETYDTVSSRDDAIWGLMLNEFGINASMVSDRGWVGRDLFDFLDAWIRSGRGDIGSTSEEGMRGIVTTLHKMTAYDYAPPP